MKGLKIVITYNCNIMCSCCRYKCGPHKKGVMDMESFKNKINEGIAEGYNDYIIIEGGEPFLFTGILFKYLKKISTVKSKKYIATNGFWGNIDPYLAILSDLKKAGIDGIIIEYDYFHSHFIDMPTIKNAISKTISSGLEPAIRAFFTTSGISDEPDIKTFEIIKNLKQQYKDMDFILEETSQNRTYIPISKKIASKEEKLILYEK